MKKKTITYLIVVIILSLVAYGFWIGKKNNNKQALDSICPLVFAEESNFKLVLNECVKTVDFEYRKEVDNGVYLSSDISIESKDGVFKRVFKLKQPIFSDSNLTSMGIQATQNGSYLFLDQGTWVVRSLEIFSLKDGRYIQINYHGTPVLIGDNYLVFESVSSVYSDVHPEIDQSGATDIAVLRLSDFNMKYLALGTENTDFHLKLDPVEITKMREDKNFVSIFNNSLIVKKVVWNNPDDIDSGVSETEESYTLDKFISLYNPLSSD